MFCQNLSVATYSLRKSQKMKHLNCFRIKQCPSYPRGLFWSHWCVPFFYLYAHVSDLMCFLSSHKHVHLTWPCFITVLWTLWHQSELIRSESLNAKLFNPFHVFAMSQNTIYPKPRILTPKRHFIQFKVPHCINFVSNMVHNRWN